MTAELYCKVCVRNFGMSTFPVAIQVGHPSDDRFEFVEGLVDTRSSHSAFPGRLLDELGIARTGRMPFRFADESIHEFDIGTARIRIDGEVRFSVVVFNELGAQPLLGAITLEEFSLAVDPVGRRLIPVPGLMMRFR